MSKIRRIFDIAKELNISHIEIIGFLNTKGADKYTIMSAVSNELYGEILEEFYQEASAVDRLRKEKARLNVVHHNQDLLDQTEARKEELKNEEAEVSNKKDEEKNIENDKLKVEKEEKSKETLKQDATVIKNNRTQKEDKPKEEEKRKLKKVDISSIADKINTTKKKDSSGSIKTSISQLSKKVSKKKPLL